jgi:hypothetical protein
MTGAPKSTSGRRSPGLIGNISREADMPTLKIGAAAMLAATLALAPATAFADQGGIPNSHAKTNTNAHPHNADPQPTKGNDGSGGMGTCPSCPLPPPPPPGVIMTR